MTSSRTCASSLPVMQLWLTAVTVVIFTAPGSEVTGGSRDDIVNDEEFPLLVVSACLNRTSTSLSSSPLAVDKSTTPLQPPTLDLRCPPRNMVRIVDLLYGSATGTTAPDGVRCHHEPGDCVTHLPASELSVPCVGNDRCSVTVPDDDRGRPIPGCGRTTAYVQASYQCIPESAVIDVCLPRPDNRDTKATLSGRQRGFLRTPGYPGAPYPNSVDCELTVEAPQAFQKIRFEAIDVELEKNGTGCVDWLEIFDGLQSTTLCGSRQRRRLGTSSHQNYRVRFRSNDRVRLKGFWIYYEVYPPEVRVPVNALPVVTSSPTTVPVDIDAVESPPDITSAVPPSSVFSVAGVSTTSSADEPLSDTSVSLPFLTGSLAGIAIGLLTCILIACIVTIIVIRRLPETPTAPGSCVHLTESLANVSAYRLPSFVMEHCCHNVFFT